MFYDSPEDIKSMKIVGTLIMIGATVMFVAMFSQ